MTAPTEPLETDRLHNTATAVLAAVEAAALEHSVTLPGKRYVTLGQAVHDCEQAAVVVTRMGTGMPDAAGGGGGFPGGTMGFCDPMWTVTMSVEIARCAPEPGRNGTITDKKLTDALRAQSADSAVIRGAVSALAADQTRVGEVTCTITFPPPTGGYAVTVGTLAVVMS